MPPWIGHLVSAIIGALVTSLGLYIALFGRVKDMEARQTIIEKRFEEEKGRVSERIYHVTEGVAAVLATANKVLEQNNMLLAELRAQRRVVNE
jgi:hypothetical protein